MKVDGLFSGHCFGKRLDMVRLNTISLVSKDVEFSCTSFDPCEKFVGRFPPTQTPTQKFKIEFSMSSSQEIGSGLVSFEMIFEALQSELFRLKFR